MYISSWLLLVVAVIAYCFYFKLKQKDGSSSEIKRERSVLDFENNIFELKEKIFALEHFDSPHFVDYQDAFEAMQINYYRLKQRYSSDEKRVQEIARDWFRYVEALLNLKRARIMLDVDMSDDAIDNMQERTKEPSIIKDEVEKKFRALLKKDWQIVPPDYFKRMETKKKPDDKTRKNYGIGDLWKYYYPDSINRLRMEEKRNIQNTENVNN
jgi:hypothetical protein